jgi:hypothetical protein
VVKEDYGLEILRPKGDESGSTASGVANYNQKFKTPAKRRAGILARDLAGPSHPDFAAVRGGHSYETEQKKSPAW